MNGNKRWTKASKEEKASAIASRVEEIRKKQSTWYRNMDVLYNYYIGANSQNTIHTFKEAASSSGLVQVKLNLIKSLIDTVWNRITSRQIRSMVVTKGGRWENRIRAKYLEKYVSGVRYREGVYETLKEAFLDAGIANIGYVMVGFDGEDVFVEKVGPNEIIVDQDQALRGRVVEAFRVRDYTVDELSEMYPELHEKIAESALEHTSVGGDRYEEPCVRVYEAWHLGARSKPGVHVICTADFMLEEPEDYDRDHFPFVDVRWGIRPRSWIGLGMAEQLYSQQYEIDREILRIQKCHDLYGDPFILNDINSKTPRVDLEKRFSGKILDYDSSVGGQPPRLLVEQTISAEFPVWIGQVARWSHDFMGISELSAQGQRTEGNDISGYAYKIIENIQSKRLAGIEIEWQRISTELDKRIVEVSRDAFAGRSKKVKYTADDFIEHIDWKDAVMVDDEYYIRMWPASIWPETPEGKIQLAQELLQAGLARPEEARAELYAADMGRMQDFHVSFLDSMHLVIDKMLYKGEYSPPDKYLVANDLAIPLVHSALLRARADGAPEERISMLDDWLNDAEAIRESAARESQAKMQHMQAEGAASPQDGAGLPMPQDGAAQAPQPTDADPQQYVPVQQ